MDEGVREEGEGHLVTGSNYARIYPIFVSYTSFALREVLQGAHHTSLPVHWNVRRMGSRGKHFIAGQPSSTSIRSRGCLSYSFQVFFHR